MRLDHQTARYLADNAAANPARWTPWHDLEDGARVRVSLQSDEATTLDDYPDLFGTFHHSPRGTTQRPAECNGAARRIDTRQGPLWWQPPADVVNNADALASLEGRVRGYFREDWSFIGVVVQRESATCECCGERKANAASLWAVESDSEAGYLAEIIADLVSDLTPSGGAK